MKMLNINITVQNNQLKIKIRKLAEKSIELNLKGGPSADSNLFESVINIMDVILEEFKIPATEDNQKLLWFEKLPTEKEIEQRINTLHQAANEYLTTTGKPYKKILQEAVENQASAMEVLPEIKIKTHQYTIFVFEKILLKGKDTVENVLEDLQIANTDENLDALGRIAMDMYPSKFDEFEVVEQLKTKGIKYIDQFNIHNSDLLDDDAY